MKKEPLRNELRALKSAAKDRLSIMSEKSMCALLISMLIEQQKEYRAKRLAEKPVHHNAIKEENQEMYSKVALNCFYADARLKTRGW